MPYLRPDVLKPKLNIQYMSFHIDAECPQCNYPISIRGGAQPKHITCDKCGTKLTVTPPSIEPFVERPDNERHG